MRFSAGFHLGPAPQDYVDHTVVELQRPSPDVVSIFLAAMHRQMPGSLLTANIGSRFTFGV
jgi:7,8-dihydropterin-6-yl-methyl-4-(beta-D-ribofuranosyl)aminobenzene 5'-phosphate synthase